MSRAGGAALRGWLHRDVRRAWQGRGVLPRLLLPFTALHVLWRGLRALARRSRLVRRERLPVPVIVVGNLTVGGAGKTPLVVEIVKGLRARGWSPGIVSRGYGGSARDPTLVSSSGDAAVCGDEPVLLHEASGAPVAVGRDRSAAARLLLSTHAHCDVLVADDGLQHWRMARDLELVVIDGAGLGNGWLLPSGPLRDPPSRLASVDAVVLHGIVPPVRIHSPFFRLDTTVQEAYRLGDPATRIGLHELAALQARDQLQVLAVCALGSPERFFDALRANGLRCIERALPDHEVLVAQHLQGRRIDRILITEKDAVKCRQSPAIRSDARVWVVPLVARTDAALHEFLDQRLEKMAHGPEAA